MWCHSLPGVGARPLLGLRAAAEPSHPRSRAPGRGNVWSRNPPSEIRSRALGLLVGTGMVLASLTLVVVLVQNRFQDVTCCMRIPRMFPCHRDMLHVQAWVSHGRYESIGVMHTAYPNCS